MGSGMSGNAATCSVSGMTFTAQIMYHERLLACREQTGPATLRPQPQRGAQNPKRPARALLPGDEVSTGPVTQKPARDPRVPRAEQLLDAAQDEAQRWRAQAMHLSEELQHAQSAAHSERQAYVAQLSGARTHLKYLGANSLDADQDVAYLTRELKQANAANSSLRAELSEALEACKVAQAATEKEAQRAADLEARNAAMQLQLAELLGRYKVQHTHSCLLHFRPACCLAS